MHRVTFLLPAILLMATACSPGSSSNEGANASNSCNVQDPAEKVQLGDSDTGEGQIEALAQQGTLKTGTRLSVVLRDSCPSPGAIAGTIPNRLEGRTRSGIRSYSWTLPKEMSREELSSLAKADACVHMVSFENTASLNQEGIATTQAIPNDPSANLQTHLNAIGASEAYDIFYNGSTGIKSRVVIAVIDSGITLNHEDIRDNLWVNAREVPGNKKDDDGNGYVDDVNGYNFASNIADPSPQVTSSNSAWQWAHGTRVAGLAAAVGGNGRGVTGVMPNARIMALNNMGRGATMSQTDTTNAIRYAVDNGANVINLSLGGPNPTNAAYLEAMKYAVANGVVVLAAAGNEASQISSNYSAAGRASGVQGLISIGNFQGANFNKATKSNYSPTFVELGAPGTFTSTTLLYSVSPTSNSAYGYFSGTSAATPVAAGAAALAIGMIKSRGYPVSAPDIEAMMLESAKKAPTLKNYFKDGNALDLAALAKLVDARYPARGPSSGDDTAPPGFTVCP